SGTCTPMLPSQRWPSGRGKKPLAPPMLPPISFTWGPNVDGSSVRSRYGPPGCSPPGLIRPRTRGVPSPPEACTSGLPALKSPQGLPEMTTAPNGELRRQDLHLQVQQLVSLRSLLWVQQQVTTFLDTCSDCPDCGTPLHLKARSRRSFRTLFGTFT